MTETLGEDRDPVERIRAKVLHEYRLGRLLLLTGLALLVGSVLLGAVLGPTTDSALATFSTLALGGTGFGCLLSGAVFFVESRAFLRRNENWLKSN
jgi:hypothetical protein